MIVVTVRSDRRHTRGPGALTPSGFHLTRYVRAHISMPHYFIQDIQEEKSMRKINTIGTSLLVSSYLLFVSCSPSQAPGTSSNANTSPSNAVPSTSPTPDALFQALRQGNIRGFEGTVGNNIGIELYIRMGKDSTPDTITIAGVGFYKRVGKDFALDGFIMVKGRELNLREWAAKGNGFSGLFRAIITSADKVDGNWQDTDEGYDPKKKLTFSLMEKTPDTSIAARIDQAQKRFSELPSEDQAMAAVAPNLDNQSASEIQKMYEKIYSHCEDSYYAHVINFVQHKEVTFTPEPREIREVDKLNGVEWAGQVRIRWRFSREFIGRQWTDYRQGGSMALNARKVKGKWELDTDFLFLNRGGTKPTCNEIPPG